MVLSFCYLLSDAFLLKLVITRKKLFPFAPVVRLVIFFMGVSNCQFQVVTQVKIEFENLNPKKIYSKYQNEPLTPEDNIKYLFFPFLFFLFW